MCNYMPSRCSKLSVRVTMITFGPYYKCMKKDFKSFLAKVFSQKKVFLICLTMFNELNDNFYL